VQNIKSKKKLTGFQNRNSIFRRTLQFLETKISAHTKLCRIKKQLAETLKLFAFLVLKEEYCPIALQADEYQHDKKKKEN
jgi:hypothetical protein